MSGKVETAKLIVELKLREDGALWTSHRPASQGDLERMNSWPSGGLHQMSHALLVEFLRRESYTLVISKMAAGEALEDISADDLDALIRSRVIELMGMFTKGAVENALIAASR